MLISESSCEVVGATGLQALRLTAAEAFADRFGRAPRWMAAAPGRVNLIGEHTDYNGGFVLPMAIDRYVVIAGAPAPPRAGAPRLEVRSTAVDGAAAIPLTSPIERGEPAWANYLRGVVAGFCARGVTPPPLDLLVATDLPVGGGLSSSAALEVAMATFLEAALDTRLDRLEKARLCRQAEHDYAGVPCGLMDQLASVFGEEAGPLLIDCHRESAHPVRIADATVSVLVCNTNVRHALADGAYAQRRAECLEAATRLGVAQLSGATTALLDASRAALGDVPYRRARHVVSENARTVAAAAALGDGDVARAGTLMYESHRSLREDFEVSCAELDTLVELAGEIGPRGGVLGARMTGGGFGGCAVMLVRSDAVTAVRDRLARAYRSRHERALSSFVTVPARGAHLLEPAGWAARG